MLVAVAGGRAAQGRRKSASPTSRSPTTWSEPRNGSAVGSIELIRQRLYNPSVSEKRDRALVDVVHVSRPARAVVHGTYFLPKGSLVVTGAIQSRLLYEIAIVGGTGLYDNARGTLTVTSTHIDPRRELLVFRLTG